MSSEAFSSQERALLDARPGDNEALEEEALEELVSVVVGSVDAIWEGMKDFEKWAFGAVYEGGFGICTGDRSRISKMLIRCLLVLLPLQSDGPRCLESLVQDHQTSKSLTTPESDKK